MSKEQCGLVTNNFSLKIIRAVLLLRHSRYKQSAQETQKPFTKDSKQNSAHYEQALNFSNIIFSENLFWKPKLPHPSSTQAVVMMNMLLPKTWNLNLHLIMITIRIMLSTI